VVVGADTAEGVLHAADAVAARALTASAEIKLTKVEQKTQGKPAATPGPNDNPQDPKFQPVEATFDVECVYTPKDGRARIEAIPGEEFLFDRQARDRDNCLIMAHRTMKTKGELIEMGIDEDVIDEWGHRDMSIQGNEEYIARREGVGDTADREPSAGEANEKVLYIESYINLDADGDGKAELRKICTLGQSFQPVNGDQGVPVDERPFAFFCPDPEPHTLLGLSFADLVKDIQLIQSSLVRGMLDSLSASLFPRIAYLEGSVSVADILNNSIGAPIRTKNLNAVMPIEVPFTGEKVLPIISAFNDVSERRTGRTGYDRPRRRRAAVVHEGGCWRRRAGLAGEHRAPRANLRRDDAQAALHGPLSPLRAAPAEIAGRQAPRQMGRHRSGRVGRGHGRDGQRRVRLLGRAGQDPDAD
jgi:hypothetical protein